MLLHNLTPTLAVKMIMANMMNLKRLLLGALLVLAACSPGDQAPTGPAGLPVTPTDLPITWTEPAQPVTLENAARIQMLGRLNAPGTASTAFAYTFSPDGTRLAALNNDLLLAWNLTSGDLIFNTGRMEATKVFYSPDKTEIYTLDIDGVVQVYNAENGELKNDFRAHITYDTVANFYNEAGWLALGGRNGEVKVWDTYERLAIATLEATDRRTNALAFSKDGTLLATGSEGGIVQVWNWREKNVIATFDLQGAIPQKIIFSPDQTQLAVGTVGYIALWSIADQELLYALESGIKDPNDVLLFSPDGAYLVSGGAAPELTLWEAATGARVAGLPDVGGDRTSAVFSPDGQMLLTSVLDGPVSLWNLSQIGGQQLNRADLQVGTGRVLYSDWTGDSFLLAFFDATGPIYMWGIAPTEES